MMSQYVLGFSETEDAQARPRFFDNSVESNLE